MHKRNQRLRNTETTQISIKLWEEKFSVENLQKDLRIILQSGMKITI
jgi:hypothetical protein